MQTKTKFIALTCVITILFSTTFAFADDSSTSTTTPTSPTATTTTPNYEPYAGIWTFFKTKDNLTADEYKTLTSTFSYINMRIKETYTSTSLTSEQKSAKILEIEKALFSGVKQYVDSTKMADYEKWVANKLATNPTVPASTPTAPVPTPKPIPTNSGSTEISLFSFLKKKADMTDAEYKAMNEAMAYNSKILMAIYDDKTLTQEQRLAKSMEVYKAFYAAMRLYVVIDKLETYDTWVAQKLATNNGYGTGTTAPKKPDNNYPPKPTGDKKPNYKCIPASDSGTIAEIKLSAKITKTYMVSLEWSDYYEKGDEDLLGYKIFINNAKGEEKVVSVDANTTEKDDWNSITGVNVYKVYAITSDGITHESNSVGIPMNSNGLYDFSLTTPVCNPKPNSDTNSTDISKVVGDAQKFGPNIVKKIKFKYKLLSETTRQLVNKKIDSIAKEKREEYLKNLLVKIDKLISVSKSSSLIAKLVELKQFIQERLDEITGTSTDDSVINDLLNDNSTTDATSTNTNQ